MYNTFLWVAMVAHRCRGALVRLSCCICSSLQPIRAGAAGGSASGGSGSGFALSECLALVQRGGLAYPVLFMHHARLLSAGHSSSLHPSV